MAGFGQPPDSGGERDAPATSGVWQNGGPSFASVTKATVVNSTPCHRFPTIQLAARIYGTKDGKPSIPFSPAELQEGVDNLKYSLVAKFSSGRPQIEDVTKAFMSAWRLGGKCSIGALDARHILIVLDSEQEANRVLAHPTRKLGLSLFRIFRWTSDFSTKKESSTTTTWIRLMSLPPQMLNQGYIASIVSSFGRFLAVDVKTATFSNPCYARVCVEIDTTASLPDEDNGPPLNVHAKAFVPIVNAAPTLPLVEATSHSSKATSLKEHQKQRTSGPNSPKASCSSSFDMVPFERTVPGTEDDGDVLCMPFALIETLDNEMALKSHSASVVSTPQANVENGKNS
ncbi:hypothetical protein QQ045_002575 [Rhodiola kirilowii]